MAIRSRSLDPPLWVTAAPAQNGGSRLRRFTVGRPSLAVATVDGEALASAARRTALLRGALALSLVSLVVVSVALAERQPVRESPFFPDEASGVLVLDLSRSVRPATYQRIYRVMSQVVTLDQPMGLVLFSDTAYEAFPPGTHGIEMRPMLRYFKAAAAVSASRRDLDRSASVRVPTDPWSRSFRGGTKISAGLRLARNVLRRDGVRKGSVLLISDLDAPSFDEPALTDELIQLRQEGLPLRIVPLFPSPQDRRFFERLAGRDAFVDQAQFGGTAPSQERRELHAPLPRGLVAVVVLIVLGLAANERWFPRLPLPRPARRNGEWS